MPARRSLMSAALIPLVGLLLLGHSLGLKLVPTPAAPAPAQTTSTVNIVPDTASAPVSDVLSGTMTPLNLPKPAPSLNTSTLNTSTPNLPTDPLWPQQWDMQAVSAAAAWAQLPVGWTHQNSPLVTVAVLDTGYVPSPELGAGTQASRVVNGYDFVRDSARAGDGNGRDSDGAGVGQFAYHAEVIANIIAAAHDGSGMAGLNPRAKVVEVRVAGVDGMIDPQDLIDGLRWAAGLNVAGVPKNPNPARVLNLSLYADFIPLTRCDARIQKALDEVTAAGALVVAGAANDGADSAGYSPAGCRNVLTVTSVTQDGRRPSYANWGKSVALAAPGGEPGHGVVASSLSGPGGIRTPDGTSFAAPHVTGVASLLLAVRPGLTPTQLRDLLTRSATPFTRPCDPDPVKTCGTGMLNAAAALKLALGLKK